MIGFKLLLVFALGQTALAQFAPLSAEQFASAKAAVAASLTGAPPLVDNSYMLAALARRGHSGDLSYLQGCDLSDPNFESRSVNHALVEQSSDWSAYQQAVRSGRMGVLEVRLPTSTVSSEDVSAAKQADQQARAVLSAPAPSADFAQAVLQLRLLSMCEVDRATGQWLGGEATRRFLSETSDASAVADLTLLAMHMDHLPTLQADHGNAYLHRREALGLPIEPGLRLKDRSLINLGLPQKYATLILCEAGVPTFAGQVDLDAANRLRQEMGLSPEDLHARARTGFCH